MLAEIHSPKLFLPESLYTTHPSHLHIDIMKRAQVLTVVPITVMTMSLATVFSRERAMALAWLRCSCQC